MLLGKLKQSIFGGGRDVGDMAVRFAEPPTLVLARKIRRVGDDWFAAKSYLGGLPRLGAVAWPRAENGQPLYFMAQLDLSEIDRASNGRSVLPKRGALGFFLGGSKRGCIVHIVEPGRNFSAAPAGRVQPEEIGGHGLVNSALRFGPHEFPFWPVEFHAISPSVSYVPGDAEGLSDAVDARNNAIRALFHNREYNFSLNGACKAAGVEAVPLYWLCAHLFADRVPQLMRKVAAARVRAKEYLANASARLAALDSGTAPPPGQGPWGDAVKERENAKHWIATGQQLLAHADRHEAGVADYIRRVQASIPNVDPYLPVAEAEAERLDRIFDETRRAPLNEYARFLLPRSWRDYANDAFMLMASGPEEAFRQLPSGLREEFFQSCRLPAGSAHLMFGAGDNVQDNLKFEEPDQRLVLQLTHDDVAYWPFGDNGVYQFWMSVSALQAADFLSADVTFECH